MKLISITFLCLSVLGIFSDISNSTHAPNLSSHYNYDVFGRDFMNTQTKKFCLLARLNVSLEFFYNEIPAHKEIFLPKDAVNTQSYCDFNYTSLLQLDFDGISFSMMFERDHVKPSETSAVYCNKCDGGHWRLRWLKVKTDDIQKTMPEVPRTAITAEARATDLSEVAGGFITHISLQRGYRCLDKILTAHLNVIDAFDYVTAQHTMEQWKVLLHIHSIELQPFLVTNRIVKDPLLCKDVTLSVVLIITMPVIYFIVFIVVYRLKDKGKFKEWKKRYYSGGKNIKKKPLEDNSYQKNEFPPKTKTSKTVEINCTAPDETQVRLL